MDNKKLKEQCVQLYLRGKKYTEIAKLTGWSRTYITNLIKDDIRVINKKNIKKIKVTKRKDNKQMLIYIPVEFIEKLGISRDRNVIEYVDIQLDTNSSEEKRLIIKKHS